MTRLFFGAVLFATLTVNANAAFNPPPDRPKPQNVPETVKNECLTDAARFFGIDRDLVFTLFDNEGGKIGSFLTPMAHGILAQCRLTHQIWLR